MLIGGWKPTRAVFRRDLAPAGRQVSSGKLTVPVARVFVRAVIPQDSRSKFQKALFGEFRIRIRVTGFRNTVRRVLGPRLLNVVTGLAGPGPSDSPTDAPGEACRVQTSAVINER